MEAVDVTVSAPEPASPDRAFEASHLFDAMDQAERYNRHILEQVLAFAGPARNVLDFGAGSGRLAGALAERGLEVTCVEADPLLRDRLVARGLPSVAALERLGDRRFDYAVSVNVLEHLADDASAVRGLRSRLNPGGRCLVYVPAFPLLWTANDTLVGHCRRYRRDALAQLFRAAQFDVVDVRHVDSLGFLAALAYRALIRSDGHVTERSIRFYDRAVFPISRILDRALHRVAGKNLLLRARCR